MSIMVSYRRNDTCLQIKQMGEQLYWINHHFTCLHVYILKNNGKIKFERLLQTPRCEYKYTYI